MAPAVHPMIEGTKGTSCTFDSPGANALAVVNPQPRLARIDRRSTSTSWAMTDQRDLVLDTSMACDVVRSPWPGSDLSDVRLSKRVGGRDRIAHGMGRADASTRVYQRLRRGGQ